MTTDQHWLTRTACDPLDADSGLFDYDPNKPVTAKSAARHAEAKAKCLSCPVIDRCLLRALDLEAGTSASYRFEIYGGLTPHERAQLDTTIPRRTPTGKQIGNKRRTHCLRGHEFTPENTKVRGADEKRECVTCLRETKRVYYARTKKIGDAS